MYLIYVQIKLYIIYYNVFMYKVEIENNWGCRQHMVCGLWFKTPVIYELFDQWAISESSMSMAAVWTNPAQFFQL